MSGEKQTSATYKADGRASPPGIPRVSGGGGRTQAEWPSLLKVGMCRPRPCLEALSHMPEERVNGYKTPCALSHETGGMPVLAGH